MSYRNLFLVSLLVFGFHSLPAALHAQQGREFLGKNAQVWLKELDKEGKANVSHRRGAAFALGKLGAKSALPALQKRLRDRDKEDVWVREAAAFALGEIGRNSTDAQLVATLAEALEKDSSDVVRRSAAFALGCIGPGAKAALPQLETAVRNEKESAVVRQNAAWALAKLGAPGIPALKQALADKDALVKRDAAASMEPLDAEVIRPVVPELVSLCKDPSSDVRRAALGVLIKVLGKDDVMFIVDVSVALQDGDEEVRNYAALTLANIGGKESAVAVPQLLIALKQKNIAELRRQAAVAIRNIGPHAKAAVPELILALKDADPELRSGAALALGGIAQEAKEAYEMLLQRVEDANEKIDIRLGAAYSLSRIGSCQAAENAVPRILTILANTKEPVDVRTRIIWPLRVHDTGKLRQMGLYPTFYKVLTEDKNQENKMLRFDCAYMLGMLQGKEVQPVVIDNLLEFLKDDNIQIFIGKKSNVGGVGAESGKGSAVVKNVVKGDARVMAVKALDQIGTTRLADQAAVVAQLRALAAGPETYEELKQLCKELLTKLGK